ncbi:MAG: diguanylate cyclase [bacterium]|nr:diguanylate cyclase [bacterium]
MKRLSRYVVFQALGILLWSLLFSISSEIWALEPGKAISQYHLDTWKTERGLPENTISCILQTRDGYIWLGTASGLVRFDGVRFTIFDKKSTKQIRNNFIRSLYEDREGNLWIGTEGGLLKQRHGNFTAYSTWDGLPHNVIRCIHQDSKGDIWIGTNGGGVARFRDGRFNVYTTRDGLSENSVRCIHEDSKGNLRIGTINGLNLYVDGKFIRNVNQGLLSNFITFIFEDRDENLWIGTDNGLNMQGNGILTSYTIKDGLPNPVLDICQDRAGKLWLGTGGGLCRLEDGKLTVFTTRDGLSDNVVFSVFEDKEGSLWIGTLLGGLNRLKDVSFTTYTAREGLADNMAKCIIEDGSGIIWIGTEGGLNCLKKNKISSGTVGDSLSANYITSIYQDRKGSLWLGAKDRLYRRSPKDGKFSLFPGEKKWGGAVISSLMEDDAGNFWVGTRGSGLHRFKGGKWDTFTTQNGLSDDKVICLHKDSQGRLWIGTGNGLNLWKPEENKFIHYTTSDGLSHNEINCIYEDAEKILWLGTVNGPNRFKDGIIAPYHSIENFLQNDIYVILEDHQGYLWMSSNKGISRVAKKELNDFAEAKISTVLPLVFGETDGMKSRICNGGTQPAGWKSSDGKLWFPTIKGVAMVDPGNLEENTQKPPLLMEEVVADGEEFNAFPGPGQADTIFPPRIKNIEFHYTALSFLQPEKVYFKYRLEGYDEEWVGAGTRRTAYYTNLSPGKYTSRAMACNNDRLWNTEGVYSPFYIESFFYQTMWFYILCFLVIVVAAAGFYSWRVRALKKHKKELEIQVADRTRQLKIANRKLTETNKELKKLASLDGLTGIYNYRWFSEFLELEWKRAIRNKTPITIILIDVDFFKLYNDTYGHQAGDECLREIARKLKDECRRPGDVVARYGGEEFIVLLLDTPTDVAADVAERLWKGVQHLEIPHEASTVDKHVTISLGCATGMPSQKDDPAWLIKAADNALYEAKKYGRNRVAIHVS